MYYEDSMIQAFLNDTPIEDDPHFHLLSTFEQPDKKRKDVAEELNKQLSHLTTAFPMFNAALWNSLFGDQKNLIEKIHICPIIGTKQVGQLVVKEDAIFLCIDFIQVANYTRMIPQMVYVMQNYLTLEITKLCCKAAFPTTSDNYLDALDDLTFTNGLANYLAWNTSCDDYRFSNEKYDPHKEKAFGLLAQAIEIEDLTIQRNVWRLVSSNDFWEQFTSVAGMFYFHDIYQEQGIGGVVMVYSQGPKDFIHSIFHS